MLIRFISLTITILWIQSAYAQQFIGLTPTNYAAIQQMPYNPAWVNNSENGTEIHFFSLNVLAGSNAASIPIGGNFRKDRTESRKHLWQNLDILGPAISFKYKDKHHIGISTRFREIVRAGNLPYKLFSILGEEKVDSTVFTEPMKAAAAGFSMNTFGEVAMTYGRVLKNDEYHILKGGVTLKYLIGFSAATLFVDNMEIFLKDGDTVSQLRGNVNALYTYNINPYTRPAPDVASALQRAGTGGLGMDIGFQYEYHPDGTPNYETPYKYSVAASITDIGYVTYYADSGSGYYDLIATGKDYNHLSKGKTEDIGPYLERLAADSFIARTESTRKFSMGLPTALRVNTEWVASPNFSVSANFLVNLKGNGGSIYKPAYVSHFNITPNYGNRNFSVSLPCTYYAQHTLTLGAAFRMGPFYIGSSSLLSNALARSIRNADFYFGFMMKLRRDKFII